MSQIQATTQTIDDIDLEYTQNKRRSLIDLLTSDMSALVSDPAQASLALKAMEGIDKQILGRKRLEVDKDNSVALQQQAFAISQILSKNSGGKNPFLLTGDSASSPPTSYLPDFQVNPGELSTTLDTERSDDFLARMKALEEQKET